MAREIPSSQMVKTPSIKFTRENTPDAAAGSYFVGTLTAAKAIDKYSTAFEFLLEDASDTTPILIRADKSQPYVDAEVGPGSKVAIFGSASKEGVKNQLLDKLEQVQKGDRVKVTFNGKKPGKGNHTYNDFKVEVL